MLGTVYIEKTGSGAWETLRGLRLSAEGGIAIVACFEVLPEVDDYSSPVRVVRVIEVSSPPESGRMFFLAD